MKNDISIGILCDRRSSLKCVKSYTKHSNIGAKIFSFTRRDINWSKKIITGMYLSNQELSMGKFEFPDVIYNRCFSHSSIMAKKIEAIIGSDKFFNCINRFDKWDVYKALRKTSLKPFLPKTYLFQTSKLSSNLNRHKEVFIKPCLGFKGKGIYQIKTDESGNKSLYYNCLNDYETFKDNYSLMYKIHELVGDEKYIVQEAIPTLIIDNDRCFDIRILLQKNITGQWKISEELSRVSLANYFVTNFCYEVRSPIYILKQTSLNASSIMEKVYRLSLKTSEIMDSKFGLLGEISVDFCIDPSGNLYIIEVNGKPDKSLFLKLGNKKVINTIYKRPIEYAFHLSLKDLLQ
jgi:hypothetical protein